MTGYIWVLQHLIKMIDNSKEYILCAAIWYNDGISHKENACMNVDTGIVLMGHRHWNVISLMPTGKGFLKDFPERNLLNMADFDSIQGFVTSLSRFVDRREAAKIAYDAGQVDDDVLERGKLYSEDLY